MGTVKMGQRWGGAGCQVSKGACRGGAMALNLIFPSLFRISLLTTPGRSVRGALCLGKDHHYLLWPVMDDDTVWFIVANSEEVSPGPLFPRSLCHIKWSDQQRDCVG